MRKYSPAPGRASEDAPPLCWAVCRVSHSAVALLLVNESVLRNFSVECDTPSIKQFLWPMAFSLWKVADPPPARINFRACDKFCQRFVTCSVPTRATCSTFIGAIINSTSLDSDQAGNRSICPPEIDTASVGFFPFAMAPPFFAGISKDVPGPSQKHCVHWGRRSRQPFFSP